MKVKELIEYLDRFNKDDEVHFELEGTGQGGEHTTFPQWFNNIGLTGEKEVTLSLIGED